jgi:hypothetical protein
MRHRYQRGKPSWLLLLRADLMFLSMNPGSRTFGTMEIEGFFATGKHLRPHLQFHLNAVPVIEAAASESQADPECDRSARCQY